MVLLHLGFACFIWVLSRLQKPLLFEILRDFDVGAMDHPVLRGLPPWLKFMITEMYPAALRPEYMLPQSESRDLDVALVCLDDSQHVLADECVVAPKTNIEAKVLF